MLSIDGNLSRGVVCFPLSQDYVSGEKLLRAVFLPLRNVMSYSTSGQSASFME